jgi:hypothetical protein
MAEAQEKDELPMSLLQSAVQAHYSLGEAIASPCRVKHFGAVSSGETFANRVE